MRCCAASLVVSVIRRHLAAARDLVRAGLKPQPNSTHPCLRSDAHGRIAVLLVPFSPHPRERCVVTPPHSMFIAATARTRATNAHASQLLSRWFSVALHLPQDLTYPAMCGFRASLDGVQLPEFLRVVVGDAARGGCGGCATTTRMCCWERHRRPSRPASATGFPRSTSRAMPTTCDVRKCPCARSAVAPRRSDGYCWQETSGPWTLNQCFERYL